MGAVVVERKQLCLFGTVLPLQRLRHQLMEATPLAVGQSLVRHLPEQGVPEPERPRNVSIDEFPQMIPGRGLSSVLGLIRENAGQEGWAEAWTNHRGISEKGAGARPKSVDSGCDHRLDALR